MAAPRNAEGEEEGRIEFRTLVIASAASATAAAVTSQLWIAGTWIAAALTPVLVTLISEAIHRPSQKIARASRERRVPPEEPLPEAAGAAPPPAPDADDPLPARAAAEPGPVRVHRQPVSHTRRRRFALVTALATGAIAFVVAVAVITTADLVSGGSVGKGSGRTTLWGGEGGGGSNERQQERGEAPAETGSEQPPAETEEPTATEPVPEETTPTEPAPEEPTPTEPAPTAPPADPPLPETPTP